MTDDPKWFAEYNKRVKNYSSNDFVLLSYDLSEKYKIFQDNWDIQLTIINVTEKNKQMSYNVNVNLDGSIDCNCKDYLYRGKKKNLPCKHILFALNNLCSSFISDLFNFFKNQQNLSKLDVLNIKNKLNESDICILCNESIIEKQHLNAHSVQCIDNKICKFNKENINHNNCHDHCLNKLYNYVVQQ